MYQCTFLPARYESSSYSTFLPRFGVTSLFHFSSSFECVIMLLIYISLKNNDVGHFFTCLWATHLSLWNVCSSVLPILKIVLFAFIQRHGIFYMFYIQIFSQVYEYILWIFSLPICIFILLIVAFNEQKLLISLSIT